MATVAGHAPRSFEWPHPAQPQRTNASAETTPFACGHGNGAIQVIGIPDRLDSTTPLNNVSESSRDHSVLIVPNTQDHLVLQSFGLDALSPALVVRADLLERLFDVFLRAAHRGIPRRDEHEFHAQTICILNVDLQVNRSCLMKCLGLCGIERCDRRVRPIHRPGIPTRHLPLRGQSHETPV